MAQAFDIISRITERSGQLRLAEQKVAEAILSDLSFAASASIGDLAGKADVSVASVTRFAKAMGCRDVRQFKFMLAQAVAVGQRFFDGGDQTATQPPELADVVYNDIHAVLELNRALLNPDALLRAGQLLRDARMIYSFGMGGGSTMMADEARYRLVRLGRPVATYHDALLQKMVAATLDKNDVLLVFSTTGNVPELLASCEIAREYGVSIVAITALGSKLAGMVDVLLPIKTLETDLIFKPSSSRYAMMMILDMLVLELALLTKDRSQERLRRLKYTLDTHRGGNDRQPLGD
ncbi:MurR/RpiR family transcriptional regulator [Herbaspirillum lusitanum]|jgi:RpiR family carbohydrate utilization transcriptional regulator|uniref:MurR/RpiR family transcriptional regulator n=1 Tax=Herbaspirillum lusitanum TaxID=213312 RepID=A0ABW9A4R1_9BURK